MALAPDADWSRDIAWSPDSRKVGFVINGQQLAVYDARSLELEAMLLLVSGDTREVRAVSLARPDAVSFDVIERALLEVPRDGGRLQVRAISHVEYRPGTRIVTPERHLGRQTMRIPAKRVSLRVESADSRPAATTGWARLQARDGRQVRVPWTRTDDHTARLPAFDAGPLQILEVGVPGRWRTAVLKDVEVADAHVAVTLPVE